MNNNIDSLNKNENQFKSKYKDILNKIIRNNNKNTTININDKKSQNKKFEVVYKNNSNYEFKYKDMYDFNNTKIGNIYDKNIVKDINLIGNINSTSEKRKRKRNDDFVFQKPKSIKRKKIYKNKKKY